MLYMVELDFPHPAMLDEWNRWYTGHLRMLLSIPGLESAQRFQATTPTRSPYVAIYTIADEGVMTSPAYLAKAGRKSPGQWAPLMTNWDRNVLDGIDRAPEVPMDGWVAIYDRLAPDAPPLPEGYVPLRPVALDRTIAERGLLFGRAGAEPPAWREHDGVHIRICKPLTPLLTAAQSNASPT